MWVWIPRYSYTIGNTYGVQGYGGSTPSQATPGAIDIKFVKPSVTETGSAAYTGDTISGYYTPNGFCWGNKCDSNRSASGNKEIAGIWVGKFETSGATATTDIVQQPIVKPDVVSWRSGRVSTFFTASRNMQTEWSSSYGFNGQYDTHMLKNTEWGAVAYLSQSKYGKYGNTDYSGALKEIYKNDSSSYYIGRSEGTAPATSGSSANGTYTYATTGGQGASTTGNITGIYDMSGGAWEYVMGNYNNYSGYSSKYYTADELNIMTGRTDRTTGGPLNSGFTGLCGVDNLTWTETAFPSQKYYNLYNTTSSSTACNSSSCKSHGLGETAGWYGDSVGFVSSWTPWFLRGGYWYYSTDGGLFASTSTPGNAGGWGSFRLGAVRD